MSVLTVLWSLLGGGLFMGGGLVVSLAVKRQFFPACRGSTAVTTVVLVWLCWALALGQLLGAFGLLREMALLCGALVSAAVAIVAERAFDAPGPSSASSCSLGLASEVSGSTAPSALALRPARQGALAWVLPAARDVNVAAESSTSSSWERLTLTGGTVLLVLLVAAIWCARTVIALHRGMNDPDSLGYHLPFAVMFAHSGYADNHRLLLPLIPVQFFPANDELLSGMALALTHSLAFAAVKNLFFGGLVVVSAHALGKAFGAAQLTVVATMVVLGLPVIAFSQPGEAVNDALLILLLVGGLAVLAHARDRPAPYVLALACAGLALGVKFSAIVPAAALGALAVALLVARVPGHPWWWTGVGLLASAGMGGSWYVRNVVNYGNPVPPVHLALGPLHLHTVNGAAAALAFSVAHYAVHGQFLGVFARGVVHGLGPFAPATAALCLVGVVTGLLARDGFRRGLGLMGAVALVGYLVTPASAYGTPPSLELFVINLHYAAPALLFAMLAGAIALAGWRWAWALPLVGVGAVVTSIDPGRSIAFWSPEMGGPGFVLLLAAAAAGGAVALVWVRPSLRRLAVSGTFAVTAVAAVGLAVIAGRYQSRRVTDPVVHWAATVRGARIAAWVVNIADVINVGDLYGPKAQNQVVVMERLVDGGASPIDSCQVGKQALRDGHFEYTAASSGTVWSRRLRSDPAFRLVANETIGASADDLSHLRRGSALVYQVVGNPHVDCAGRASPTSPPDQFVPGAAPALHP